MPTHDRTDVIALMRRTGHFADIATAYQVLPDRVDTEQHRALLESLGLTQGGLMEDLGSSP